MMSSKIFFTFLIIILLIIEPSFRNTPDKFLLLIYSAIFLVSSAVHLANNKTINWFRLDVIFILGFSIVHFQWPLMHSLSGLTPSNFFLFWGTSSYLDYMNYGTWLSTIGLVSWFLGYSLLKKINYSDLNFNFEFKYKLFYYFTLLLFVLFILSAGKDYLSGAIYKDDVKTGGIFVYFQLLLSFSILVLITILILNNIKNKYLGFFHLISKFDKKITILFTGIILLYLIVGDRGGAIQPVFTFLILYGTLINPITKKQFVLLITTGALVLTIVGLGRGVKSEDNVFAAGTQNLQISSAYDITLELANSSRTLYKALSLVPRHDDFFYGKLWTNEILANIPIGQSIYLNLTNDTIYELSSSKYLTYQTRGRYSTWGEGTSLIADIYLNFGIYGVIVFMLLLGIFFKKIINEFTLRKNLYWIVAGAILAAYAFYIGRGGLFYPLRPIIWSMILVLIFIKRK